MSQIDYEINKELGECYLFMGEYDKARDYYNKAIECDGGVADPFLGLAAIAVQKGNYNDALAFYTKASQVNPGEKSFTGMGMIEVEQGSYATAFEHFAAALSFNPGNMLAVNSLVQLGYVLNRLDDVLPHLEAALEPGDTDAVRYTLAACLMATGKNAAAKRHLEILLGANPANTGAKELYAQLAA
ncbi:MAG: tetratricopeptide repeat protein [Desulfovibrio sp.]|jgi:tetratricopeptide (TPR) repeat protein|nr:tetratricopeptide repeat protein [Desulfovibrio sp.]